MPRSAYRLLSLTLVVLASGFSSACLPDGDPFDVDIGTLNVRVQDQNGPVNGAKVEVRTSDGRHEGTQTTPTFSHSPGLAWLLVSNGDYTVHVTPPATHRVPSTQPHPVSVKLRNNETVEVVFTLTKSRRAAFTRRCRSLRHGDWSHPTSCHASGQRRWR